MYVSATPGEYEKERSAQIAEQIIRPTGLLDPKVIVKPVEGQIDDLISEINERTKRNERTLHSDRMPIGEALQTIRNENAVILQAIDQAMPEITKACEAMVAAIRGGGRVFYIGCGTSGRLGVLDAVECPPTYGVPQELFTGITCGRKETSCSSCGGDGKR